MARSSVSVNDLTVVHKNSGGKALATIPDICKTPFPPPVGTIPLPYPNIAESKDLKNGSILTQIDGQSVALAGSSIATSRGDEIGILGGIISGCTNGEAFFIKWSQNVTIEGRPVVRKTDMMIMNKINTISLGGMDQEDLEDPELAEERGTIEFNLVDDKGKELPDQNYTVKLADGTEQSGTLDEKGYAKLEDVPKERFKVRFPDLEEDQRLRVIKDKKGS